MNAIFPAAKEIIAYAEKRMAQKEGMRLKVRAPANLWDAVMGAAREVGEPAEHWARLACLAWMRGKLRGVPIDENLLLGTRETSVAVWVRVPHGFDLKELRRALAACVAHCEAKRIPVTPQAGTETWRAGVDYFISDNGE